MAERMRQRMKREALTYYGDGKCACIACGFDNIDALTLDHISDDGAAERRRTPNFKGYGMLARLRTLGWPPGYQTLCANCNLMKEVARRREIVEARRSVLKSVLVGQAQLVVRR